MVWQAGLHKVKGYDVSGQIFGFIFIFFSNRQIQLVLDGLYKNNQLIQEFLKAPFLLLPFSYYTLMTYDVICNITICTDDGAFFSKCDQAFDL